MKIYIFIHLPKVTKGALSTVADGLEESMDQPDCNCPADCTETVYSSEMSQATLRSDSTVFDKVKKHPLYQQQNIGIENATK